jgi:membrane fusion protein
MGRLFKKAKSSGKKAPRQQSPGEPGQSPLFRKAVLLHQQHKSLGDIVLIRPLSFTFLTACAVLFATCLATFLIWGSYTRKAHVTGHLVPSQGLIKIFAPQPGIVIERLIQDGQTVRRGDTLFILSVERESTQGATQKEIIAQLSSQEQSLRSDLQATARLRREHERMLKTQVEHLRHQLTEIEAEITLQNEQVRLAEITLERYQNMFNRRFVPEIRVHEREAALLDQRTELHSLIGTRVSLLKEQSRLQAELGELPLRSKNEEAEIMRNISAIKQRLAEAAVEREVKITAPLGGLVTATLAYTGQLITEKIPLLSIIPSGTQLQAELYASSRAIGFVKPGNTVLLRYETYPYQKFGIHQGTVTGISRSALRAEELPVPVSPAETYYRITAILAQQTVPAYGKLEPLQPGMQLQADILLDRRALWEWVLDPLYSITGE